MELSGRGPGAMPLGSDCMRRYGGVVGEDAPHCFRNHVNTMWIVTTFKRNPFKDMQGFDHGDAAGTGRRGGQNIPGVAAAFILCAQDFAHSDFVIGEVFERDESAVL